MSEQKLFEVSNKNHTKNKDRLDLLEKLYYTPNEPSSFSSKQRLYKSAKKLDKNITIKDVSDWLLKQRTYTIHKSRKKKV